MSPALRCPTRWELVTGLGSVPGMGRAFCFPGGYLF